MGKTGKNKKGMGTGSILLLLVAVGIFGFAGFKLVTLGLGYLAGRQEYSRLMSTYTAPLNAGTIKSSSGTHANTGAESGVELVAKGAATPTPTPKPMYPDIEDAEPPLKVDWKALKKVNPDIVGWVYVDALPQISYPICRTEDNDYYLHHTFEKKDVFAGAIFEDYHNEPDFSDPNTIIYGHNMKDESMFGSLKHLADHYEENPYFWVLTPKGDYRYHIYSIMSTAVGSDVYMLFPTNDREFFKWEQDQQKNSEVKNDVKLYRQDKVVVLSTCTGNSSTRRVVIGKCVSTIRPRVIEPTPMPVPTREPTPIPTPVPTVTVRREEQQEALPDAEEYVSADAIW